MIVRRSTSSAIRGEERERPLGVDAVAVAAIDAVGVDGHAQRAADPDPRPRRRGQSRSSSARGPHLNARLVDSVERR